MTLRLTPSIVAAVVAATVVTSALAAAVAGDPKTLVLQKSDFPAGAKLTRKFADSSPGAASYYVSYRYTSGSKPRQLSSYVVVLQSVGAARVVYREFKGDVAGGAASKLALPKYGDEQLASFLGGDGARLLVRKKRVVWLLELSYDLNAGLTKPEAIVELRRFGPKQAKRVGSG